MHLITEFQKKQSKNLNEEIEKSMVITENLHASLSIIDRSKQKINKISVQSHE
jgi:hypothetical protein